MRSGRQVFLPQRQKRNYFTIQEKKGTTACIKWGSKALGGTKGKQSNLRKTGRRTRQGKGKAGLTQSLLHKLENPRRRGRKGRLRKIGFLHNGITKKKRKRKKKKTINWKTCSTRKGDRLKISGRLTKKGCPGKPKIIRRRKVTRLLRYLGLVSRRKGAWIRARSTLRKGEKRGLRPCSNRLKKNERGETEFVRGTGGTGKACLAQ